MNILFICNQGKYRSKTAQDLFSNNYITESAGIFSEENPLTKNKLKQADIIFTMDENQRSEIASRFPKEYIMKKIISLNIPDIYQYKDPKLIIQLKKEVKRYLK
jgi:predicted protein tyrosine phosphatase